MLVRIAAALILQENLIRGVNSMSGEQRMRPW
jgi:hypothetical protein